jgi:hypothetical protein
MERDDGPYAVRLAREPGKRDSRFAHLFSGEPETAATREDKTDDQSTPRQDPQHRIAQLEVLLLEMQEHMEALEARVDQLEEKGASL